MGLSLIQRQVAAHGWEAVARALGPDGLAELAHNWPAIARPEQIQPGREGAAIDRDNWRWWLILAGRGFGKTRTGAETVKQWVLEGQCKRIALVGRTASEVRDIMVEGESGILNCFPDEIRPEYKPGIRRIIFHNGAIATTYTADTPDQLRGAQQDGAWMDEWCAWRDPKHAMAMLDFGLRLGNRPRGIITTTPRPQKVLRELMKKPNCVTTSGSSLENAVNVSPDFIEAILAEYGNTKLGQQEIYAAVLDEFEGALWKQAMINYLPIANPYTGETEVEVARTVVGVDPAVTSTETSDMTGIVVDGKTADGRGIVLDDLSGVYSPEKWARKVVDAFWDHHADCVVAEVNQGGDLVEHTIKTVDPRVPVRKVRAKKGKLLRAEPIALIYEKGAFFHSRPFVELESQMTTYVGDPKQESPDRLDAHVYAASHLFLGPMTASSRRIRGGSHLPSRH